MHYKNCLCGGGALLKLCTCSMIPKVFCGTVCARKMEKTEPSEPSFNLQKTTTPKTFLKKLSLNSAWRLADEDQATRNM